MKSLKLGKNTSNLEVLNISINGVWLLVNDREFFLTYDQFPWFKNATVSQIQNVRLSHETHLRWIDLDVDLDLESLENPEKYPLVFSK